MVIVELGRGTDKELQVGFVVDAMQEVRQIDATKIEGAPAIGSSADSELIRGFAKLESGIVILLEVDLLLSNQAARVLQDAGQMGMVSNGSA